MNSARSTAAPRPVHPLHGLGGRSAPVAVAILIIWLSHLGWSAGQIVPVLTLLAPAAAVGTAGRR